MKKSIACLVLTTLSLLAFCQGKAETIPNLAQSALKSDTLVVKINKYVLENNTSNQSFVLISGQGHYVKSVIVTVNDSILPITFNSERSKFTIPGNVGIIDSTKKNTICVIFSKSVKQN